MPRLCGPHPGGVPIWALSGAWKHTDTIATAHPMTTPGLCDVGIYHPDVGFRGGGRHVGPKLNRNYKIVKIWIRCSPRQDPTEIVQTVLTGFTGGHPGLCRLLGAYINLETV
jgi:hypothetical protein